MPCYLCNAIEQNVRGATAGDHLVESGFANVISQDAKELVTVTHYKCSECGAKWRYVDDPADSSSGWNFVQRLR